MTPSASWPDLCARLDAASAAFTRACADLKPDRRERPGVCGQWSPRQVAAHLAGWDREAARRMRLFLTGPAESVTYDIDAFNARSVAERARLSWEGTLDELHAAFTNLKFAIAVVPPEAATPTSPFVEWVIGRTEDYEFHLKQLMEWTGSRFKKL
jgi:uncharacterized protein (TIGR03083 family)